MPNQTPGRGRPTAGRPTSRRKWASFSRSNASLDMPMKKLDADQEQDHRRGPGVAEARQRPSCATRTRRASLGSRPAPEAGLGHEQKAEQPGQNRDRAAGDHSGLAASRRRSRPAAASPPTEPMYAIREPLRKTRPTLSTPTSSVIQASSAPLVNVYARPQNAQSAMIAAGARDECNGHPGDAHPDEADDQRQRAAVGVGDDSGRDLEQEHGRLHRRAHEDELERREIQLLDEVHRHDDPGRHGQRATWST